MLGKRRVLGMMVGFLRPISEKALVWLRRWPLESSGSCGWWPSNALSASSISSYRAINLPESTVRLALFSALAFSLLQNLPCGKPGLSVTGSLL